MGRCFDVAGHGTQRLSNHRISAGRLLRGR